MKARKVKRLDPDGDFATNARQIAEVRLDELERLAEPALASGDGTALHDMRIAAKRLRYVLELSATALGPAAQRGAKTAKRMQSLLGDIHDCDEGLPRVAAHVERLRAADVAAMRAAAADGDLAPSATAIAPNRELYGGLEALATYLTARRAVLLDRVRKEWAELEPRGFATNLLAAISSDAPAPPAPPDGAAP